MRWKWTFGDNQPHEILKDLIGCTAQCPFCGEQCDYGDIGIEHGIRSDVKHRTTIHRPACIRGYTHHMQMEADSCPYLVVTDKRFSNARTGQNPYPYKDYQMFYPDWSIPSDCTYKTPCIGSRLLPDTRITWQDTAEAGHLRFQVVGSILQRKSGRNNYRGYIIYENKNICYCQA